MGNHKVISVKDSRDFVVTASFLKLIKKLKSLKRTRGRMILVIGAPGTGKSSNIYHALEISNLNIYEPVLLLDSVKKSSKEVYNEIYRVIKKDLNAETVKDAFREASKFDLVLVADKFLDSEFVDERKVGLAEWTNHKTILATPFFIGWIFEYLRRWKNLKEVNLLFQTAWTIEIRGFKYDIITDFGPFSKILSGILKNLFEVVEIDYTEEETIKIVKTHNHHVGEKQIRIYMKKYGNKPRFILQDLENKEISTKKDKSSLKPVEALIKSSKID